jgi:DNA-binding NarL/FixJ family response regulator
MTRLLVAHDHPIVTAGIKEFLFDYEEFTVAGEAGSGTEAVRDASFPHKLGVAR